MFAGGLIMETEDLLSGLCRFGINGKDQYFEKAFSRNLGLLTIDDQEKLKNTRAAVPGLGGVGGSHLMTLTRTGFGKFNIADFDEFDPVNVNRQVGARLSTFGRKKLDVMKEDALDANPYLEINTFSQGVTKENIDEFLRDVDIVIDSIDFFNFEARRFLFKEAAKRGLYVITAGSLGFSSAVLIFSPTGMGFDEYFNINDKMTMTEKYISFAIGLAPKALHLKYLKMKKIDFNKKAGPSLNIGCQLCSGIAAAEAVKIVLNKGKVRPVPYYYQYDAFLQKLKQGVIPGGNKNLFQKMKINFVKKMARESIPALYEPMPQEPEFVIGDISGEMLSYIVKAGAMAPSGDNCQPWKFEKKDKSIDLVLDEKADESFFNISQKASIISCGAAAENIKVTASRFGLRSMDSGFKDNKISIKFINGSDLIEKDELSDFVWQRCTNRKLYGSERIEDSIIKALEQEIESVKGARLNFILHEKEKKKLAKIVFHGDKIRTENKALHEHLMEMIRFTDEEAIEKRDGFHIKNLEAGAAGEVFLKLTRNWEVMRFFNLLGVGNIVSLNSLQGILNSSGCALLTMPGKTDNDFFNGGKALERVWLKLTSLGISMQPMTAITLFFIRMQENGVGEFSASHGRMLRKLYEDYKKLFKDLNLEDSGQIMLFRFGYGESIKYKTLRKSF